MEKIINLWPSMAELARDMGIPQGNVGAWKRYNSIPSKYDLKLVASAKARGFKLSLDDIATLRAEIAAEKTKEKNNG
jgi:transcriptional regulator with XRE-family HTH domain